MPGYDGLKYAALEAKRDIGAEILQSIRDMKAGKGKVVLSPAVEASPKFPLRSLA